jgi:HSP20 family molecular chaperone IbpA
MTNNSLLHIIAIYLAVINVADGILTVTMPKSEPKQKVTKAIEVS